MSQRHNICCVGCIHSTLNESPMVLRVSLVGAVPEEPSARVSRARKAPNEPSARIARVKAPSLRPRADLESARRTPCSEQFLRQHSWSSGSSPKPSGSQICSGKSGLPILLQQQISKEPAQARRGVRGPARCGPFVCAEGCALKELRVCLKKQTH